MGRIRWFITALAPVLWGTMPLTASEATAPGHPLFIATVRSLGAGLVILALFRRLPPRAWLGRIVMLGMVNISLTFGLFFVSASHLPGGMITIFMALAPFWAALLSWPLLGQPVRAERLLLIAFCVLGVALLVRASPAALNPIGVLAGLGASASMGCGIVLFKKWNRPDTLLVFTGWQLLAGGLFLAAATLRFEPLPAQLGLRNGFALGYLVLAATIVAYGLWFRGIEQLGVQRTSMLLLLVPMVGIAVDIVWLGKHLTVWQGVGAAIVLSGLIVDTVAAQRLDRRPAQIGSWPRPQSSEQKWERVE
ncbi:DMT family transporter [Paraburkholderia metrosideri]|uniref:DMT family transporter n=1 Tax=Paraburkholderia metrosideri TaxID=580937 RepID=A0ABW9DXH1_9BURK